MARKKKIEITLTQKEEALVHYQMEFGRNNSIKRQSRILYYANRGTESMKELIEKTGTNYEAVKRMLNLFDKMGVEAIYHCKRGKRINHLDEISEELEAYFDKNPPSDVPDAVRKIKEKFGLTITATPVRYWLKKRVYIQKNKKYSSKS